MMYWITWEDHRRSKELATHFGAEYVVIESTLFKGASHIACAMKTINFLRKAKGQVVIVQNPSIILAFVATLFKGIWGYKIIVDRHTNFRLGKPMGWNPITWLMTLISNISISRADLTIVTNNFLKHYVDAKCGKGFVLPDKVPNLEKKEVTRSIDEAGLTKVLFICTFADDEPFLDVIAAAKLLDSNFVIEITGNYKKHADKIKVEIPSNVKFLGFVPEDEYIERLNDADIIMDFTTLKWCLVCGGYEALAVHKPLITSDTVALREIWGAYATFIDHSPESIATAIKVHQIDETESISSFKRSFEQDWLAKATQLEQYF